MIPMSLPTLTVLPSLTDSHWTLPVVGLSSVFAVTSLSVPHILYLKFNVIVMSTRAIFTVK